MHCPVCGSVINDACRYCTVCGSPIECADSRTEETPQSDGAASERAQAKGSTATDEPNGEDGASPSPEPKQDPTTAGRNDRASAQPVTFSAAMDDTRKSSKRRMPLVIMLALAMALVAGTAFAAYQIYVNVIAPMQNQAAEQPRGDESAAQTPVPEEPLTVDVEERRIIVSTMSDPYYGDGERTEATWIYPVLVGARQSDAIDAINAFIEGKIEQDAAWTEGLNADNYMDDPEVGTPGVIVSRYTGVTFLSDRYVCVFDAMHTTWWGAHGNAFNDAYLFDLETGEQAAVAQAAGVSEEELAARADAAVRVFYNREGSDIYTVDEAVEHALEGTYYLADEGVILATDDYALGRPNRRTSIREARMRAASTPAAARRPYTKPDSVPLALRLPCKTAARTPIPIMRPCRRLCGARGASRCSLLLC